MKICLAGLNKLIYNINVMTDDITIEIEPVKKYISMPFASLIILFTVIIHSIATLSIKILNPLYKPNNVENIQFVAEYTAGTAIVMTTIILCITCHSLELKIYQWLKLYEFIKKWCIGKTLKYCVIYAICDVTTYIVFNFLILLIISSAVSAVRALSIILTFTLINYIDRSITKNKAIKIAISYSFIITGTFLLASQQKWSNLYIIIASILPITAGIRDFTRWKIKMNAIDVSSTQINVVINVFFLVLSFVVLIITEIIIIVHFYEKPRLAYDIPQMYKAILSVLIAGIIYALSTSIIQWMIQLNDASVLLVETLKCSNLLWIVLIDKIRFGYPITDVIICSIILVISGNLIMAIPFSKIIKTCEEVTKMMKNICCK